MDTNDLEASRADGRLYSVFSDAAFGSTDVIQCMVKSVYHPDDRSFNAIMSRIRVHIENVFTSQSKQFTFLSFTRSNKMGGLNWARQFIVVAIFMNIHTTFYGNHLLWQSILVCKASCLLRPTSAAAMDISINLSVVPVAATDSVLIRESVAATEHAHCCQESPCVSSRAPPQLWLLPFP
jgi:hypothetical protein